MYIYCNNRVLKYIDKAKQNLRDNTKLNLSHVPPPHTFEMVFGTRRTNQTMEWKTQHNGETPEKPNV